ncbi:MAG: hypothetical protein NTU51_09780 [Bacteroidetes bacterium]|nr:hypothetical protein [Bacteroidota bacterium]
MKSFFHFLIATLLFTSQTLTAQVSFRTNELQLELGNSGQLEHLISLSNRKDMLYKDTASFLIKIKTSGGWEIPSRLTVKKQQGIIRLYYPLNKVNLELRIAEKPTYLTMELISVTPQNKVDFITWGPLPLTIGKTVAEILGISSNDSIAVALMPLNVKTLGGFPLNDEGSDPSRSSSARKTGYGSMVQAYSMDRSRERKVTGWWGQYPEMPVEPVQGETIEGSKVALFACKTSNMLNRIEAIELAEGLPHPMIEGTWSKRSLRAGRSYLICDYSEETIDELLEYTRRANLQTLYHMNAWESWGHYELSKEFFPHGLQGLKTCMEKAKNKGILLGAHTLTNFINTSDAYVTPVPDHRLAVTGISRLTAPIIESDSTIMVESPTYFTNEKADWLHAVRIDDELIVYRSATSALPYQLKGCKRGAFGTKPSPHPQGKKVNKLLDHPYKVFFPNLELQQEIAVNLAKRFNETGFAQMDFDGFEGCLASGQGDYAQELFAKTFYENLDHWVLNGTSMSKPFYWHINTYCNWGEPWNGGFTESMQQYRIDNQGLFDRNLMPHMLGWYLLTDSTTLPEMEWMLARAAGYNAGFGMATSLNALKNNPHTPELLDAIRDWEICRRDRAFPKELLGDLKDPSKEFHLEKVSAVVWNLYPMYRLGTQYGKTVYETGKPYRILIPVE